MKFSAHISTRVSTRISTHINAWWLARHARTDTLTLTQRNVYILPTRAGLMFGVTLLVLLVASINYQLNLGYVLTFLLAGSAVVSMHLTHGTLRGLSLHLRQPAATFAGEPAAITVTLSALSTLSSAPTSRQRQRHGIGLRVQSSPGEPPHALAWSDVPEGGQAQVQLHFVPPLRGQHTLPALTAETRFPLGLFRAWTVWRPASTVLVYPRPEQPAAPLPTATAHSSSGNTPSRARTGEVEGVRNYRSGDPLQLIAWKKAASTLASTGELVSRDTLATARQQLWLDWQHATGLAPEDRLSRLCAWVLSADRLNIEYGLRLSGTPDIPPALGDAHRQRCLEALALWA